MPSAVGESLVGLLDETAALMEEIDAAPDPESLGPRIRAYNDRQLSSIRSQQRPVDLGFARDQWFDTDREIDEVLSR